MTCLSGHMIFNLFPGGSRRADFLEGVFYSRVPGIVAAKGKIQALISGRWGFPALVEDTVIVDAGRDVPAWCVDVLHVGVLFLDLAVGAWEDLHNAACTGLALGLGFQAGFRNGLCLEPVPVEAGAEVVFRVFPEMLVIVVRPVGDFIFLAGDGVTGRCNHCQQGHSENCRVHG